MPEGESATTTQVISTAPTAESATAPQEETRPDDRLAAFEARLAKAEALEKENHSLRTERGRLQAQLKVATKNYDGFVDAFSSYEESKAILLGQGYSEEEVDAMAEHTPSVLKKLAKTASPPAPANGTAAPADEIKALRAEIEALKSGKPKGSTGEAVVTSGRPVPPEPQVNDDNIDALYLAGKVSGEKYAAFLRTVQL